MDNIELNKIYLGDSYALIKNIADKSIDCVYTDIPYSFVGNGFNGGGGAFGTKKRDYHGEYFKVSEKQGNTVATRKAKNLSENNDIAFGIDFSILDEMVRILKKINVFIWCSKSQLLEIMNYFLSLPDVNYELLVWNKTNPIPTGNNTYLSDIEYCLHFRETGVKLNDGYDLKSKHFTSPINKADKEIFLHPTIKPLELVKRHLAHATQDGDIVFDPFIGSGTTAVASKELGRNFIGFEIDENYYKIATDRLMGVTQQGQISIFADFEQIKLLDDNE